MLLNLKMEILKRGISQRKIARFMNMDIGQFNRKVNERNTDFTRREMYKIHDEFFSDTDMYYLFKSDD